MSDFKKLVTFPAEDEAILEAAKAKTQLSANQIIVRCFHDRIASLVAEHVAPLDLSPLPEAAVEAAYKRMTAEELAIDRQLGQASLRAQAKA